MARNYPIAGAVTINLAQDTFDGLLHTYGSMASGNQILLYAEGSMGWPGEAFGISAGNLGEAFGISSSNLSEAFGISG